MGPFRDGPLLGALRMCIILTIFNIMLNFCFEVIVEVLVL
jgi:hypothetical protein